MITGILLAAGRSTRFGANKLLHPLPGGNAIGVVAASNLLNALPHSIAVVRATDSLLAKQLAATGIGIVANENADSGMGSSLACGINATTASDGWVIALADMPFIQAATILAISANLVKNRTITIPCYHGKKGHPVGFGKYYQKQLGLLAGDGGGREILRKHKAHINAVAVDDPGILVDIDSPIELRRHLSRNYPASCHLWG